MSTFKALVVSKPDTGYSCNFADFDERDLMDGDVTVRIRVSSNGAVQVLGVVNDLGYGLGASAVRAVQATHFQPATDASGRAIDWEGIVRIAFQLAG